MAHLKFSIKWMLWPFSGDLTRSDAIHYRDIYACQGGEWCIICGCICKKTFAFGDIDAKESCIWLLKTCKFVP